MRVVLFLICLMYAPLSQAGLYLKLGGGLASPSGGVSSGISYTSTLAVKTSIGYTFHPTALDIFGTMPNRDYSNVRFGFEWSIMNFGPSAITGGIGGTLNMYAESFSFVTHINHGKRYTNVKIGFLYIDATTGAGLVQTGGFSGGLDYGHHFNDHVSVYGGLEVFIGWYGKPNTPVGLVIGTIGLRYDF